MDKMSVTAAKAQQKRRQTLPPQFFWFGFLCLSLLQISVNGFVVIGPSSVQQKYIAQQRQARSILLWSSSSSLSEEEEEEIAHYQNIFASSSDNDILEIQTIRLLPHKPLGMTVEESLADDQFVLITRVVEGGFAEKAGLQVGDVLVGVTNLFAGQGQYGFPEEDSNDDETKEPQQQELAPCIGLGVEKIKGMVSARPPEEALEIKIARGTNVMDEHEKAVIELCSMESDDKQIEQCVVDYLSMDKMDLDLQAKSAKQQKTEEEDNVETVEEVDADADDLVGNMYNLWADELPPPVVSTPSENDGMEQPEEDIKPWSSRSSPSGTFVRDPATGEMKNIG